MKFTDYYGLPKIGLQLQTMGSVDGYLKNEVILHTSPTYSRTFKCKYCGNIVTKQIFKKTGYYCNKFCAGKAKGEIRSANVLKSAIKIVSNNELKAFLKEYSGYVFSEIYKYELYHEDLQEFWNVRSINILANLKRNKISRKSHILKYLKKTIKFWYLQILNSRKKEVFYSELSMKNQIRILGDVIEERI